MCERRRDARHLTPDTRHPTPDTRHLTHPAVCGTIPAHLRQLPPARTEAHVTEAHKVPRRDEVPVEHTWDLALMYASDAVWGQATAALEAMIPEISALEGTVGQSAATLLRALKLRDDVGIRIFQIYRYASHRRDSDSTDPAGQALAERAGSLYAKIAAATAFIEPEILAISEETIAAWQREEPALALYAYALEELARQRAHVRSAEVEAILAQFYDVTRATHETFEVLTNADLDFPTIEDESGQAIKLSHARYGRFMESQDRRVRCDAFKGMFGAFGGIRNTVGTTLAAEVRSHALNARIRNYGSALEAALQPHDIPLDVYHNLIATVNDNLPRLHRYMRVRKQLMGLDELRFYDLYAPLVPQADIDVPYAEATATVQAAFAPLGEEYAAALKQAFSSRWIDVYENVGKRSGAYSGGAHRVAPFILM